MTRSEHSSVCFGVIGTHHVHVYDLTNDLLSAEAALKGFCSDEDSSAEAYIKYYDDVTRVADNKEILNDPEIDLVVVCVLPPDRADIACAAMRAGKDVLLEKPGALKLEDIAKIRQTRIETGRICHVVYGELLLPSTLKALELYQQGRIGDLVSIEGFGPHSEGTTRPDWFYDKSVGGGILTDIGCHQAAQFMEFTDDDAPKILSATCGNIAHPEKENFFDTGTFLLKSGQVTGYTRMDWFIPEGLGIWGDIRTVITGTKGYLDVRKTIDLSRPGTRDTLFVVDQHNIEHIECTHPHAPFFDRLLEDIRSREETAASQERGLRAMEIVIEAQTLAEESGKAVK